MSADLLIHVRNIAHPDSAAQRADVEAVLAEIGVAETTPRIEAWNKLDLIEGDTRDEMLAGASRRADVVAISALSGEGVDTLLETVAALLTQGHRRYQIALDTADGAGAAWLHAHGEVIGHRVEGDHAIYDVRLAERDFERFNQRGA